MRNGDAGQKNAWLLFAGMIVIMSFTRADVAFLFAASALALANARKGRFKYGFAFAGENAYRINKIISVRDLMDSLISEYSLAAA